MRILITGVAGFIGSNLARRLLKEGRYEIIGIDNLSYGVKENIPKDIKFILDDIRNPKIENYFKDVDFVFHLAAKNCINDCQLDPVETVDINVRGTVNVFEAARKNSIKKVIYAESSALYEGINAFPTREYKTKPLSFYAISKLAIAKFAEAYKRFYDLNFTALRYFCVYGPAQDYRRSIPPVMSAFIIKLLKNEPPLIYGDGTKRRDFVYVDDVNNFHIKCIHDRRTDNKTFNLGSGVNYSVFEIYTMISNLLNKKIEPIYLPDLPGEAEVTLADITEAKKLGWNPHTSLEEGLLNMINYIKEEIRKGNIK